MKNILIACIAQIIFITALSAQSGVNILNHDINSPPNLFSKQSSQASSKVFRELLNIDTIIDGQEVKIRSYSIQQIHSTMRVTCYYFPENGGWICKMAKFFSNYQATSDGIGYIGKNTFTACIFLLNFNSQNGDEFKNIDGVLVTGRPPWAATLSPTKEYIYSAQVPINEVTSPLISINKAIRYMDSANSQANQPTSDRQKPIINGFFGLF